ncbi:O-acetyl-ADP-ribose deacetylase (regulator of RNase III) [Desulfobaculum xiamenense]|uniref:O-acetyl-ADP-ribose deacetylase (Regulator of RNase III) n=1 Tax=Desulfobaculum xiamenense TaxID=995050 RepID=A0A846QMV9_9BACT|nr:macro domain-containing protein [Desulfobaculum xiamenense]NJB66574.1 O-acetyl-ADP-ribose deacetylase (regulator of RNase III) [Desulfobaculum xiamenense]
MITTLATWTIGSGTLLIETGDITTSTADAIVNAANSRLAGGGGVDGAIHDAAGPELLRACAEIIAQDGTLPPGRAVVTPGFRLSARLVVHTVGPIWRGGTNGEDETLASAYRESVLAAATHGATCVHFPAISCGVYRFPIERAAGIALKTIAKSLREGLVNSISMVIFSRDTAKTWLAVGREVLGPPA